MIKLRCRHCGQKSLPRTVKVKGKEKEYTEAFCPSCNVAIKGLSEAEQRAAEAPELDGVTLAGRKALPAGVVLKQMKRLWRKLHPADRFRFYEWLDKRERAEHGQV